jgi:hypothetical protein
VSSLKKQVKSFDLMFELGVSRMKDFPTVYGSLDKTTGCLTTGKT